jgi:uncharacterized membrane protein YkoI
MFLYLKNYSLIALLMSLPLFVQADYNYDHNKAQQLLQSGQILPLQEILQQTQKTQPGSILDVQIESNGDEYFYIIKFLTVNSKVIEILYNAKTGEHLATEDDLSN